jgi:ABC-type branched-subunit amino acid transport system substrate-binding protein
LYSHLGSIFSAIKVSKSMEKKENQGFISRRGILKSIGLAGAAVVASPILHGGESALKAATNQTGSSVGLKAGVILPSSGSGVYDSNFTNVIYLYLDDKKKATGSVPFTPFIIEANAGASIALGKLITENNIDIAVGLMNTRIALSLVSQVEKAKINFLEANLGENFFHKEIASERFFQHSLNLWQAHYVLGEYAAKNFGKQAVSVTSFIDSGYDALYGFQAGFESSGGKIIQTFVTGSPSNTISPVEAAGYAARSDAQMVFANFSGHEAAVFLSAFKKSGGNASKKILASGMMVQPRLTSSFGNDAIGIISAHTWAPDSSQSSAVFSANYRAKYSSEADDFAVLGYETAVLLSENKLGSATFNSVRGNITMNKATHSSEAPVYIIEMARPDDAHFIAKIEMPHTITNGNFRLTDDLRTGAVMMYPAM